MNGKNILAEKSINFAVKIIGSFKVLSERKKEYILSKQLLKSGTSVGAPVRESQNAEIKADLFISLV